MSEIISLPLADFSPNQIFECGQCFRWNLCDDGSYIGVVQDKVLKVSVCENNIVFENSNKKDIDELWNGYFDLKSDYAAIKNSLSDGGVMDEAIKFGGGIRILKQEPWETLISFIISSNNNIPRIKKIIEAFCTLFGDKVEAFGKVYYTFPRPEKLVGIDKEDLKELRVGYRDVFILDAIGKVNSGEVDLEKIALFDYGEAKAELMKIKGVGPKVADCIALFGLGKQEAFPVDVWVRRVLHKLYNTECTPKQAAIFAEEKFGKYAGIAQQYLFYYMRENSADIFA